MEEAETSSFQDSYVKSSVVRVRGSGCHLYFVGGVSKWNETFKESCHWGNSVPAICGSKWLTGILEYFRLLLHRYSFFFFCNVCIADFSA